LNGGTCTNTASGYSCACPAGYIGVSCEVINGMYEIKNKRKKYPYIHIPLFQKNRCRRECTNAGRIVRPTHWISKTLAGINIKNEKKNQTKRKNKNKLGTNFHTRQQ